MVGPDVPVTRVTECDCQKKNFSDQNLARQWQAVPMPDHAEDADGNDSEMTTYQLSTDTLWEFRQARKVDGRLRFTTSIEESVAFGVLQFIGSDPRIGFHFLYPGCGYGGSCFPKDVQALIRIAGENDSSLKVLQAVEEANEAQKHLLLHKIRERFGAELSGMDFASWGLAFKLDIDDMRAASLATIRAFAMPPRRWRH